MAGYLARIISRCVIDKANASNAEILYKYDLKESDLLSRLS